MSRVRNLLLPLLGILLAVAFATGCQSTPEGEKESIKKKLDELELKANKLPQAKLDIQKKVAEFQKELDNAGDDLEKLKALRRRVDKYLDEVNKMADPTGTAGTNTKPVGSKIGASPSTPGAPPAGGTTGTQPGGKLGGGTAPPPAGGTGTTPPPSGGNNSGFGGK